MGLFFDYFRRTLRLPFISASGPLALLAEGGADCLDTVREIILILRDQFLPARCEDVLLVRFAAVRGIRRAAFEPEEYWLSRVRFAYAWYIRGGRASALEEALCAGFGFISAKVVNLRDEDPARWASFRIVLDGAFGDLLSRFDQLEWAINEVKPARSKLAGMTLQLTSRGDVPVMGGACCYGKTITLLSGD